MTCSGIQKEWNRVEDGFNNMLSPTKKKMWITSGLIGAGILTGGILLAVFTKNRGFIALGVLGGAAGFGFTVGAFSYKYGADKFAGDALREPGEALGKLTGLGDRRVLRDSTDASAARYESKYAEPDPKGTFWQRLTGTDPESIKKKEADKKAARAAKNAEIRARNEARKNK